MSHGKRFLLYSQHMGGTGHFVRTCEIAKALGEHLEVYLVDGGRPVPRELSGTRITIVQLPRICRSGQNISPFDSDLSLAAVMRQRRKVLLEAIERYQPDVVLIEHFPFRRWELYSEIVAVIQEARSIDRQVKIVCSLRDIPGISRLHPPSEQHDREVLETLHEYFDQLLVHADPRVVRLDEQVSWADNIRVPMEYTGYVSQRLDMRQLEIGEALAERKDGSVIVSAGGTGCTELLPCAIDAWKQLVTQQAVGNRALLVFLPLSVQAEQATALKRQASGYPIRLLPYSTNFLDWMQEADLSINHAGYNTCTNVLETRTRCILVPNLKMSDQPLRARRFAERGLAVTIDPADLTPQRLAQAILDQLDAPKPEHNINLDGARITGQILERRCNLSAANGIAENESPIQAA